MIGRSAEGLNVVASSSPPRVVDIHDPVSGGHLLLTIRQTEGLLYALSALLADVKADDDERRRIQAL